MNTPQGYVAVTGATGAIGREIVRGLLKEEHDVLLLCRNEKKMETLAEAMRQEYPDRNLRMNVLNLGEEQSVRRCVREIADIPLTGLINNAGVMNRRYIPDSQGRELTLAVNYHNTSLFSELLLSGHPELKSVVFTTSMTRRLHRHYHGGDIPSVTPEGFSQLGTYALSKRLLTDRAALLAARYPTRRINCADPGVVDSGMIHMDRWYDPLADRFFRPFIRTAAKGAEPSLRAFRTTLTARIFCRHITYRLPIFAE